MNFKNAKYSENGLIDCEIEHPDFGWIPFTANPDDTERLGRDIYALALKGDIAPYIARIKSVEEIYSIKLKEIHKSADDFVVDYLSRYSEVEKETWAAQRKETDAWLLDNSTLTPKLDLLATARGIERLDFIQKVIKAITTLEELSFQVVALQQAKEDELLSAKTLGQTALNSVDTTLILGA
jgi:hypothetical protein